MADGPTVLFAIHVDDLIDEAFVRAAVARNCPVIAVLSPDPKHSYHLGGIDYEYDPDNHTYRGHSGGRADSFVYAPSPFAKYYRYRGDTFSMGTLVSVYGERVVVFDTANRETKLNKSEADPARRGFGRYQGNGFTPTPDRLLVKVTPKTKVVTATKVQMSERYSNLQDLIDSDKPITIVPNKEYGIHPERVGDLGGDMILHT